MTAVHSTVESAEKDVSGGQQHVVTRRTALGVGVVSGAALLTACGSSTATTATTAATSAGGKQELAKSADVPSGGSLVVTVGDKPYALAKKPDGSIVAHTGVCTHQQCSVAAAQAELKCPCHGSKFDAFTGAVLAGPASSPLAEVAISESSGGVFLA